MSLKTVQRLGLKMKPTSQQAWQADGKTKMETCGEVDFLLCRNNLKFETNALIVSELGCELLAGMPFFEDNECALDFPSKRMVVGGRHHIPFSNCNPTSKQARTRHVVRCANNLTIFPGDFTEFSIPALDEQDATVLLEPLDLKRTTIWPTPTIETTVAGRVRLWNDTSHPITLKKHQHVACATLSGKVQPDEKGRPNEFDVLSRSSMTQLVKSEVSRPYCSSIDIDPDNLFTSAQKRKFVDLHNQYDDVFNPTIDKYNDASGRLRATINIGPVHPPKSKAYLPDYSRERMSKLQDKMDELEGMGVLGKPEDYDVIVECVSPSFLVGKTDGTDRLVTNFNTLASFVKVPPSRPTSTDEILLFLARWKYVIKSDMTNQFFQLPLARNSMKFAGVITPYKGIRIYLRAAMGMPGSTEHLDQLVLRVLGDLIHEGVTEKIADDLYVGGNTPEELLYNWKRTLEVFKKNNLRLKASKSIIAPKSAIILGWNWNQGTISVPPHKVNPLVTADPPNTAKALRGWLGSYKQMKGCVEGYSSLLSNLETAVAGKESGERVQWSEQLKTDFDNAQKALGSLKATTVPRPSDRLVITCDGAVRNRGIGSVLYVIREDKMLLAGFYSMKLSDTQSRWLPCEQEALAIANSLEHWRLSIRESEYPTRVLTDSKPCVQAAQKLARGEFSASARIVTFLSTLGKYRVTLQHISAEKNMASDYLSRNPQECTERRCQICTFAEDLATSICPVSVTDVLNGKSNVPFANPMAWRQAQNDDRDMRRAYTNLKHGSTPQKKSKSNKDVKKYYQSCSITNEGLMVVAKKPDLFENERNLTVIPRKMLHGLITALHLRLNHPTVTQLKKIFNRRFYGLESEKVIESVTSQCAACQALARLPTEIPEFSTSVPPNTPGVAYASDVIRRNRQKILVTREVFSSYTTATLVPDETKKSYLDGLVRTTSPTISAQGAVVRCDNAPSLQSLAKDTALKLYDLRIDLGHCKNPNKNPIGEKCVRELEDELCRMKPEGDILTETDLALATKTLNARIRNRGLSSKEILLQRDHFSGNQLKFNDQDLADSQFVKRLKNHPHSANSKAPRGKLSRKYECKVGDLVYIKSDKDKHTARSYYIVVSVGESDVSLRKFVGSSIRSKTYLLKRSDVYPITGARADFQKVRLPEHEHDSSESEDESENFFEDPADSNIQIRNHDSSDEYEHSNSSDSDSNFDEGSDTNENQDEGPGTLDQSNRNSDRTSESEQPIADVRRDSDLMVNNRPPRIKIPNKYLNSGQFCLKK